MNIENKERKKKSIEEQILKIKLFVDQFLTPEARRRLKTVELAHPQNALNAYMLLFQLIQSGQIRGKIDEDLVKKVLLRIAQRTRKNYRIVFK